MTSTNTDSQQAININESRIDQIQFVKTIFTTILERFMNDQKYSPIRTIINDLMIQANQELQNFLTDELKKITDSIKMK